MFLNHIFIREGNILLSFCGGTTGAALPELLRPRDNGPDDAQDDDDDNGYEYE
jgi:hypothetical protein